jgi:hypothetical protein
LLKKWIVSSTTNPRLIAPITDALKLTLPRVNPHNPNAIIAGSKFGSKLIRPIFKLRNAKISILDIRTKTNPVPKIMVLIFFCVKYANNRARPVPDVRI